MRNIFFLFLACLLTLRATAQTLGAVYPLEDHGFVEPSSWSDEYKRILKLYEQSLR